MEDDEEEALARALELSRIDHQLQSQRASANPPDQKPDPLDLVNRPIYSFRAERKLKIVP